MTERLSALADRCFGMIAQATSQQQNPVRWVIGRAEWRALRKDAHYVLDRPGADALLLGIPITLDNDAAAGFGLVSR